MEQEAPEDRDDDDRCDRRQEDQRPEESRPTQSLVQQERQEERHDHDRHDRADDVRARRGECPQKQGICGQIGVVVRPDEPFQPCDGVRLEEAEADGEEHLPELEDHEERQDRQDEQDAPVRLSRTEPGTVEAVAERTPPGHVMDCARGCHRDLVLAW
jgi:hypothetical protein